MRCIVIDPGKEPVVCDIENELSALQQAVGGYIEAHELDRDGTVMLVNEEGFALPTNRDVPPYGRIYGTIVLCGSKGEEFCDIAPAREKVYLRKFSLNGKESKADTRKIIDELDRLLEQLYGDDDRYGFDDYQYAATRTVKQGATVVQMTEHALHGMVSELGEIHSFYQKVYQGHEIDREHLKKEVGDLLWFIAEFCTGNGWRLSDVALLNIEKLKARYPEGFSEACSLNRSEEDV